MVFVNTLGWAGGRGLCVPHPLPSREAGPRDAIRPSVSASEPTHHPALLSLLESGNSHRTPRAHWFAQRTHVSGPPGTRARGGLWSRGRGTREGLSKVRRCGQACEPESWGGIFPRGTWGWTQTGGCLQLPLCSPGQLCKSPPLSP